MRTVTQGRQLQVFRMIASSHARGQPINRRQILAKFGQRMAHYLDGLWKQGYVEGVQRGRGLGSMEYSLTKKGWGELGRR